MRAPPRERFLEFFAVEAESRLRRLTEHVLVLEAEASAEVLAAILRDAHSLKGAAAVVELGGVASVMHRIEDELEPYRNGAERVPGDVIDTLLAVLDGLGTLVTAIAAGTATDDGAAELLGRLDGAPAAADPPAVPAPAPAPEPDPAPDPAPAPPPAAVQPAAPVSPASDVAYSPGATSTPAVQSDVIELPAARVNDLVRAVGESTATTLRLGRVLGERLHSDPESVAEYRDLSRTMRDLHVQAMRARTVPVGTVTGRLHRAVRDTAKAGGKVVAWQVEGEDTELDRSVLQQLTDCLIHIVRNAVDHGIEPPADRQAAGKPEQAVIRLVARNVGSDVVISIVDDGRGIDTARLRERAAERGIDVAGLDEHEIQQLIFSSGVSTAATLSETSGRGVGLDVVRENVERLHGRVELLSAAGVGTEFRVVVPVAAAVVPCLVVTASNQRFAVPLACVASTQAAGDVTRAQGVDRVWVAGNAISLASLSTTLGVGDDDAGPVLVVSGRRGAAAYRVGAISGQRDVMVAGLGPFVPKLPLVSGAAVEADGSVLFVLDGEALGSGGQAARGTGLNGTAVAAPPPPPSTVLVADDSLPVRELQRSILENAGYRVVVAEDGEEALALLDQHPIDLILTDVDMPRLDGFGLTRAIRARDDLANVPVVLLTARGDAADRANGMEAGADEYIVKQEFGEAALLSAVDRLIGAPRTEP